MKNKVYYGASQVYYGKSSTSFGPIRLLDLNQLCTKYRLDAEPRELRYLVSRGALSCRRPKRSEGATKGSEAH